MKGNSTHALSPNDDDDMRRWSLCMYHYGLCACTTTVFVRAVLAVNWASWIAPLGELPLDLLDRLKDR